MEIIMSWLVSGYIVGMTCMSYLIIKSWIVISPHQARMQEESGMELNWLGMALVSAGVALAWSFIGIGIHLLMQKDILSVQLALLAVLFLATLIISFMKDRKVDAVALNALFFLGLAFLLPRFFAF